MALIVSDIDAAKGAAHVLRNAASSVEMRECIPPGVTGTTAQVQFDCEENYMRIRESINMLSQHCESYANSIDDAGDRLNEVDVASKAAW